MNEQNLKILSPSEARKNGQKGGKASGEARRRRKSLKEAMSTLLELSPCNNDDFNRMAATGLTAEDMDNVQLIAVALFEQAKKGDVAAIRELRDMIGEKEAEKIDQSVTIKLDGNTKNYGN